ncbi:uncharacterized protein LOC142976271 [Anticarsia gemmatalis]|uniref:uncharacterized protein LOC142976271 n=1 Tax=Anticarsia gemmatalis TaxID=129554 RepID=UPI003F76DF49
MPEIAECLNRRYRALDDLIKELNSTISSPNSLMARSSNTSNVGLRLMCDFWNILKDDPECNLTREVQKRMGIKTPNIVHSSRVFGPRRYITYMAAGESPCASKSPSCCQRGANESNSNQSPTRGCSRDSMPLSKVLCNLNDAVSFDKKCHVRVKELLEVQRDLSEQIKILEEKEKAGVAMLKEADCMWMCMEDTYKKKVGESLERQRGLLDELRDVEGSVSKWRKNKKEVDFQLQSVNRCMNEMKEKMNQKKNDLRIMDTEITNFRKRVDAAKKEADTIKKSMANKKASSADKLNNLNADISKAQKKIQDEVAHKKNKHSEGSNYVKEAREDLQKICKCLLQKKLENEDLRAEKEALSDELGLLQQTYDSCKLKCKNKEESVMEEIKKLGTEITEYKNQCVKCHECVDTDEIRKYCTDCPKCLAGVDCKLEGDHCEHDPNLDCVCMSVKQKFLDNVFDNMYTVLARQSKTNPGKAVAEAVLKCLKRSRNGKLNPETRKILQDFILTTVKKNLNLTIVGGAVKTRCELDPDTYKQLMVCLKEVKVEKPAKQDKSTAAKKEPCQRWGGSNECNCPKGPKGCICMVKAPPPPKDPTPCPPPDKEDLQEVDVKMCPHRDNTICGTECSAHGQEAPNMSAWRPSPCAGKSCPYSKNMRAAQCTLGSEGLGSLSRSRMSNYLNKYSDDRSGSPSRRSSPSFRDRRGLPRDQIIEEVMGSYDGISPIEKLINEIIVNPESIDARQLSSSDVEWITVEELLKEVSSLGKSKDQVEDTVVETEVKSERLDENDISKELKKDKQSQSHDCLVDPKVTKTLIIEQKQNLAKAECIHLSEKLFQADKKSHNDDRCQGTKSPAVESSIQTEIENTKHLKTAIVQCCDKSTQHWEPPLTEVRYKLPCAAGKIELRPFRKASPYSQQQRIYVNDGQSESGNIDEASTSRRVSKKFKVVIENNSGQFSNQFTELTKTDSGNLTMELNDEIIQLIEERTFEKPYMIVSLKKTIDGHLTLDFDSKDDVVSNTQRIVIRSTPSGTKLLEMHKSLVSSIENLEDQTTSRVNSDISENDKNTRNNHHKTCPACSVSFDVRQSISKQEKGKLAPLEEIDNVNQQPTVSSSLESENKVVKYSTRPSNLKHQDGKNSSSLFEHSSSIRKKDEICGPGGSEKSDLIRELQHKSMFQLESSISSPTPLSFAYEIPDRFEIPKKMQDYSLEFRRLYEKGNVVITLQIKSKCDSFLREFETVITKSPSGAIGADLIKIASSDYIPSDGTTNPVILSKTMSGTYIVNIDECNQKYNAVFKKCDSGTSMLIPIRPQNIRNFKLEKSDPNIEELYKIKIAGYVDTPIELPAVLKKTESNNYTIVLDKEFENRYKQTLKVCVGKKKECFVHLKKAQSGYVIDLNANGYIPPHELNALVVKTGSGNIKVLVQGPVFDDIDRTTPKRSSTSSAQVFGEILSKLHPASSREFLGENLQKSKHVEYKSSSDTQLYDNVKGKLQVSKALFSEPAAVLKKTDSGQYAVILNKESKKTFINNLRSYLASNSNGLVPIKRTESGNIQITLNSDNEERGEYGSLKITSSGNIYVIVSSCVKGIEKYFDDKVNTTDVGVTKCLSLMDKSVATTCNARPEDCDCELSKCVCAELQLETVDWLCNSLLGLDGTKSELVYKVRSESNGKKLCSEVISCFGKLNTRDKSPHIVIKPSEFRTSKHKLGSTKQCYYVTETFCPYHKDRYVGVSNELIEITGMCNKAQGGKGKKLEFDSGVKEYPPFVNQEMWNSLNNMPPQLPPFLRNITYK